ncbi:MAG: glycosyltransferase [Selenomonadaceae bacterium]
MRFLIVAASIGSGHMKAAEAIQSEIKNKYEDAEVLVIDFTKWSISWATAFMKACYLFMLRFIPNLYDLMYRFTGGKSGGLSVQSLISMITSHDIKALTRKYRPDVVICTHPFPEGAANHRHKNHPSEFMLATVITDYSVHQMWIYHHVDCYFVARESMRLDLIAAGIAPDSIFVTGIPVSDAFHEAVSYEEIASIREKLKLDASHPSILIMGGGLGLGGMDLALSAIEKIKRPVDVIVVAGRNEKLRAKAEALMQHAPHHVVVFGFTTHVRELMAVSSFIITKPGALTISEAMAAGVPLLLHEPIPGPETQNAVLAVHDGIARWVNDASKLSDAISELLDESGALESMRRRANEMKKPYAARDIVSTLMRRYEAK